jgi:HPt (histidine-containing phosphotransfer) domain-containing protein
MLTLEKTKNPDAQSDHIDHAMLGDLSDLLGPDRFRVELESFQDEAAKLIGQIAEARTEGNISNLQSTAHRLAGACGIFGAMALHRELQELETLCKKGEKHAALAKVDSVEETWEAAHAALARAADRL